MEEFMHSIDMFSYDGMGMGSSLMSFLPFAIILIFIIIAAASRARRGRSLNTILEEFDFNENSEEFLSIKGRASGFLNWILSKFGKARITSFTCNKNELKYEESRIKYSIPLFNITCVSSGMLKNPVTLLVLGILFIIIGIIAGRHEILIILAGLIIGLILIIIYIINRKTLYIGIYIGENKPFLTIIMKRGIIDSIDKEKFEFAVNMLKKTVLENNLKK